MTTKLQYIAEMSGNHNHDFDRAIELVLAAAKAGASHLKLQTYTPDSITLNSSDSAYKLDSHHPLWGGRTLYDLYSGAFTPYEWHEELFDLTRKNGMVPFSTPFDEAAVDFLENLDVQLYKIASLEIVDLPLIRKVAETKKPMIISTGTASLDEVEEAVETALAYGGGDLTLLVCTSDYPADPSLANLARIPFLNKKFGVKVGLSDHTIGTHVSMAAIALGASAIEKHLTLSRDDGGVDSGFSATPDEFEKLVREGNEVSLSIGSENAWSLEAESQSRRHRPSIIVTRDVPQGGVISTDDVSTLRPNIGLPPKFMPNVIGRTATRHLRRGEGVNQGDFS